jgi:nicotinate-nucleotide adenylyltransferase
MRMGVFGGTFDPIHLGHLIAAEQCREQAQLDQVRFIPAARPPHKQGRSVTAFHHRAEMLRLAVAGHGAFAVDELENEGPGLSYTADTLAELHKRFADAELHFILGSDGLPDLAHWHEPERIFRLAALLLVSRPGWSIWPEERLREALRLPPNVSLKQQIVEMPGCDISSRDLRARVAKGRSIRYLVPRAVECYIETHRLYQTAL